MSALADVGGSLPSLGLVPGWLTKAAHWWGEFGLLALLREHVLYTVVAVLVAALIALPLGLFVGHTGRGVFLVAGGANAIRAVPALGLLLLFVKEVTPHIHHVNAVTGFVGRGGVPYVVSVELVLIILAIPPILTNTYAGVQNVDPAVRDAAAGMGMTGGQVVRRVEFPVALPLIFAGLRSAVLQVIATATIAGYLPFLGGLGYDIFNGLQSIYDHELGYPRMISAAIVVAGLAVLVDLLLLGIERVVVSRGISGRYRTDKISPLAQLPQLSEVSPAPST